MCWPARWIPSLIQSSRRRRCTPRGHVDDHRGRDRDTEDEVDRVIADPQKGEADGEHGQDELPKGADDVPEPPNREVPPITAAAMA